MKGSATWEEPCGRLFLTTATGFSVCRKLTEDAGRVRIMIRQAMMLNHPPLRADEIAQYLAISLLGL